MYEYLSDLNFIIDIDRSVKQHVALSSGKTYYAWYLLFFQFLLRSIPFLLAKHIEKLAQVLDRFSVESDEKYNSSRLHFQGAGYRPRWRIMLYIQVTEDKIKWILFEIYAYRSSTDVM